MKKKPWGAVRSVRQRDSIEWDTEMTQKSLFFEAQPYIFEMEINSEFTFSFITTFSSNKIDPKV